MEQLMQYLVKIVSPFHKYFIKLMSQCLHMGQALYQNLVAMTIGIGRMSNFWQNLPKIKKQIERPLF